MAREWRYNAESRLWSLDLERYSIVIRPAFGNRFSWVLRETDVQDIASGNSPTLDDARVHAKEALVKAVPDWQALL